MGRRALLRALLVFCGVSFGGAFESLESKKEKDLHESRIILRYATSTPQAESLQSRVKHLENLRGVSKAEALPSLDMAVVVCKSPEDEDEVLEALQSEDGVELAVPDTWVELDQSKMCSSHPKCKALGLTHACCPASDGAWLECCDPPEDKHTEEHGFSTISLQSWHGGYISAFRWGSVGHSPDLWRGETRFYVVPHSDGYVSLKTQHGAYLVASPPGRLESWHRGRQEADDFEKFKLIYNKDGSVSLRSKSSDKYVAAEMPDWGVLSADRDEIDDWEKFNVTVNHGWDTVIPNDEKFEKLWGLNHYGGRDIDAPEAWRFFPAPPSNSIVVAVIDTGIDYTHADLKDRMWVNPNEIPDNGIDDDGNGIIDDVYGADFANGDGDPFDDQMHGTHCAGTIAGHGNNGEGVAGVAWSGVKLMALKFLSATGGGRTSDAIKCLNYAVAMGAKITSNSWGGGGSSSAMRVAIERAERAGVLFIAAAGNEGSDNDAMPHYPSNYAASNVVSIASTTKTGSLSSFSCYGQETVDVAAPGSAIYSTIPNQKYASLSGTSMATPHVSGLAALIWLYRPNLAMSQVIDIILDSATREDALLNSSVTSARINARRALLLASRYRGLQPPVHKPLGLSFEDTDPEVGLLAGDAKITRAWDESDIDYYSLHFISSAGFLLDTLATVEKTAELGPVLTIPLVNLTIPKYAAKLAVVAGNATGRAEPFMAVTTEIKDYCVPQYGPSRAQWLGDADGRPGFVAGALQFRRASSEKSLTHYNVYWHRAAALAAPQGTDAAEETTGFLGKVPASGFERPSCEGDCELLEMAVSGDTYVYERKAYDNNEMARISFSGPATVVVTRFRTEKYYDFLEVDDMQLTGTKLALPMKIKLEAGPHSITWSSDRSETEEGWSLELHQKGTTAEYQLASIEPPVMELSVVAAFDDTEGAAPALGRLEDFDASTMPPSAALTARDLRFVDGNVQQDLMTGKIEFWPPQHGSSSVTFYRVYFADAQGAALPDFTWKLDAPDSSDQMLHIDIDTQKPAAATTIVVVSGNDHGEGAKTQIPLLDIVRSAPLNATFSGDSDPVADQVRGDVYITAAPVTTGITSYTIYLGNGTKKDEILGRVSPLPEPIIFSFHVRLEAYQRSLIVVSTYDDVEMEEGVHLDFEDFVDTSDLGFSWRTGANGRSLSPSEQKETEPWLHHGQRRWNERKVLWSESTDEPDSAESLSKSSRSSGSGKRSATSKMALKVKGSLTIPGLPVSSDASEMSGTTIPPSLELRQALLSSLAEVLSLDTAQLRLTQGERAACETLKRGATEPGTRRLGNLLDSHPVCLLVHFEVLPDGEVALHPKLTQDFLDRVEAKMIRLNQGHHQAKLDAALAHRLHGLTTLTDLHALIGEPQQVAPKARSRGGSGRVLSTFEESGTVVTIKESEPGEEPGYILVAVLIGAVLGTLAVACAARTARKERLLQPERTAVDPVAPDDVSVHLDARE